MKITFTANTRVLGYHRGDIVTADSEQLPEPVKATLRKGIHLTMIDPLEFPDASGTSTDHTEEYRQASGEHNGHQNPSSSGGSEEGTSVDSQLGNGGNGRSSRQHSSPKGDAEG